jgi:hypothetical protein
MEHVTARLFDLIEKAPFESLNEDEQAFVLTYMTMDEYAVHRSLIEATSEIASVTVVPQPLILPGKKNNRARLYIYQSLFWAASIVIAWLVLQPKSVASREYQLPHQPVVVYLHDTIRHSVPTVQFVDRIVVDTFFILQQETMNESKERFLNAGSINYPSLAKSSLENTGLSLVGDCTIALLPKMLPLGY